MIIGQCTKAEQYGNMSTAHYGSTGKPLQNDLAKKSGKAHVVLVILVATSLLDC